MPRRGGSPERGTFFRLKVHERVGILLFEVDERVGKSVIWVVTGPKKTDRWILWLYKVEKTFNFFDWFPFKWECIYGSQKGKLCEINIERLCGKISVKEQT